MPTSKHPEIWEALSACDTQASTNQRLALKFKLHFTGSNNTRSVPAPIGATISYEALMLGLLLDREIQEHLLHTVELRDQFAEVCNAAFNNYKELFNQSPVKALSRSFVANNLGNWQ